MSQEQSPVKGAGVATRAVNHETALVGEAASIFESVNLESYLVRLIINERKEEEERMFKS